MRRPEGTLEFRGTYPGLLDSRVGNGCLLRVVTGSIVFVVERNAELLLSFIHSTPGLGTRSATVDLREFTPDSPCERFFFALVWSPRELRIHVGRDDGGQLLEGSGSSAPFSLQVDRYGGLARIGGEGVQMMGARVYLDGKAVLVPTAIKLWRDTRMAVDTLATARSDIGYLFEVVVANAILST